MNMFNGYNQPMYESDHARESALKKPSHVTPWPYSQNFYHNHQENAQVGSAPPGWHSKVPYPGVPNKCACAQCLQGPWYPKNAESMSIANNQEMVVLGGGGSSHAGGSNDYGEGWKEGYQRSDAYHRGGGLMPKGYPSCSYPETSSSAAAAAAAAAASQNYNPRVKQHPNADFPLDRNSEQYMRLFGTAAAAAPPPYGHTKLPEQRPKYWEGVNRPFYPTTQQYQYPPSSCRYPPYNNPYYYHQGSSQQSSQGFPHQNQQQQPHNGTQPYYGIVSNPMRPPMESRPQLPAHFAKQDINNANKISPLRLMRKKKLTETACQLSPPRSSTTTTTTSSSQSRSDNAPPLDVRRFLATWDDEDEDTSPVTPMIVLDCQDINDEQAALLRLYEGAVETHNAEAIHQSKFDNQQLVKEEDVKNTEDVSNVPIINLTENEISNQQTKSISPIPASPGDSHDSSIPMLAQLPTSEYRKNKFLDYDGPVVPVKAPTPPVESEPNYNETPLPPKKNKKRNRKPTIKFSIKKSHDLKISLQVMNDNEEHDAVPDEAKSELDPDSRDSMTLQLEETSDEIDLRTKRARKIKRKRVVEELYSVSSEDQYSDIATDGFQVEESVDSAKIKLTFKRRRGELYDGKRPRDDDLKKHKKSKRFKSDNETKHGSFDATSPEEEQAAADTTTDYNGHPPHCIEEASIVPDRLQSPPLVQNELDAKDALSCDEPVNKTAPCNEADSRNDACFIKINNSNTSSPKITSSCHITSPRTSTDSIERELQAIWNGHDQDTVKDVTKQATEEPVSSNENITVSENTLTVLDESNDDCLKAIDEPLDLRGTLHSSQIIQGDTKNAEEPQQDEEIIVDVCEPEKEENNLKLNDSGIESKSEDVSLVENDLRLSIESAEEELTKLDKTEIEPENNSMVANNLETQQMDDLTTGLDFNTKEQDVEKFQNEELKIDNELRQDESTTELVEQQPPEKEPDKIDCEISLDLVVPESPEKINLCSFDEPRLTPEHVAAQSPNHDANTSVILMQERKGPRTPAGEPPTPNHYASSCFSSPLSNLSLSPKIFESDLDFPYRRGPRTPEDEPLLSDSNTPYTSPIEQSLGKIGPRTPEEVEPEAKPEMVVEEVFDLPVEIDQHGSSNEIGSPKGENRSVEFDEPEPPKDVQPLVEFDIPRSPKDENPLVIIKEPGSPPNENEFDEPVSPKDNDSLSEIQGTEIIVEVDDDDSQDFDMIYEVKEEEWAKIIVRFQCLSPIRTPMRIVEKEFVPEIVEENFELVTEELELQSDENANIIVGGVIVEDDEMLEEAVAEEIVEESVAEEIISEPISEDIADLPSADKTEEIITEPITNGIIVESANQEMVDGVISEEVITEEMIVETVDEEVIAESVNEEIVVAPVIEEVIAESVNEEIVAAPVIEEVIAESVNEEIVAAPIIDEVIAESTIEGAIAKSVTEPAVDSVKEPESLRQKLLLNDDELEEGEIVDEYIVVELSDDDDDDVVPEHVPDIPDVRDIPLPPGEAPKENCFDLEKIREMKKNPKPVIEEITIAEEAEELTCRNPSPPGTPRIQSPIPDTNEACVDLRELCCDEDADVVPDDAEFQDVMANCLANAEKFLDRDDVEISGDVNEQECSKNEPVSSRDVLLSAFEVPSDIEIGVCVSSGDVSMDFSPCYAALGTESLPVDNWPYLEEEVPLSPNWSARDEDVPLQETNMNLLHPLLPKNLSLPDSQKSVKKIRRRTLESVNQNLKHRGKFLSERQCTDSDVDLDAIKEKLMGCHKKKQFNSSEWQPKVMLSRVTDSPKSDCEKQIRPAKKESKVKSGCEVSKSPCTNTTTHRSVKPESHTSDKKMKEKLKDRHLIKNKTLSNEKTTSPQSESVNEQRSDKFKVVDKSTKKSRKLSESKVFEKDVSGKNKMSPLKKVLTSPAKRNEHSPRKRKRSISQPPPPPPSSSRLDQPKPQKENSIKWVCEVCGFDDEAERIDHIKTHSFCCYYCHLAFKSEGHFIKHLEQTHKDLRKLHHCMLCELSFETDREYRMHLETREHTHLEAVEKNTINTLFTLLSGKGCPEMGSLEPKPKWLPDDPGAVHFYHKPTPLSLAIQYWNEKHNPKLSK